MGGRVQVALKSALALAVLLSISTSGFAQTDQQQWIQRELRHAQSLERAGQHTRALTTLEGVLTVSPADPGAILAFERISRRLGQPEAALPVVERAIEAEPGSSMLRQVKLRLLTDLGWIDEVIQTGDRWVRMEPGSDLAYRDYAAALQRLAEYTVAERILLEGIINASRPASLYTQLADLYLEQRQWPEAVAQWFTLLDRYPDPGWDVINYKLETLGPESGVVAATILRRLPEGRLTIDEQKLAAIAALYSDRPGEARRRAEKTLHLLETADRERFVAQIAKVAAAREEPALVAWAYRQMLFAAAGDSTRWDLARQIVRHDVSAGDTTAALATLSELLERTESGTVAHRWASGTRIRLWSAEGNYSDAERGLRRHVESYPDDPSLPALALAVADAYVHRGRIDEAAAILELVPRVGTTSEVAARIAASRAYLALYSGQYDEARFEFEVAAATLSGEERGESLRFLGFLRNGNDAELKAVAEAHRALQQNRPDRAFERLMDGLRGVSSSRARPAILLWAGEMAAAEGRTDRAETVLRLIPELYPESGEAPVALVTLAEALAADGRPLSAIEVLETMILEYPDSALTPLGRRRLAELKEEVPRS
jgi:tetratricopeptide (TPR) repeat protein